VRELQNVVHRSLLACRGDEMTLADLPPDIRELGLPSLGLSIVPVPATARMPKWKPRSCRSASSSGARFSAPCA